MSFLLPSSTTALPQSSQQSQIYDPSSNQRPAAANLATPDPAERQHARLVCLASPLFSNRLFRIDLSQSASHLPETEGAMRILNKRINHFISVRV